MLSANAIETDIELLKTTPKIYRIANTISADLQANTESSNKLIQQFDIISILYKLKITPRKITKIGKEFIKIAHNIITTKEKYSIPALYSKIFDNSYNFKNSGIKKSQENIAIFNMNSMINNELLQ